MNIDYCVEAESYDYTTRTVDDFYFNSDEYQGLTAAQKMDDLWEQLTEN